MDDASSNVFLCYDDRAESNPQNAILLKKFLSRHGYKVFEFSGQPFVEDASARLFGIDEQTLTDLHKCVCIIICVSRELKQNNRCRKICEFVRKAKRSDARGGFECLFMMMQGDYTTQSYPHCVDGWLAHHLRDTLWYPAWSTAHIASAGEAVGSIVALRRKQLHVVERKLVDLSSARPGSPQRSHEHHRVRPSPPTSPSLTARTLSPSPSRAGTPGSPQRSLFTAS